jgi:peptidoglycan/xylan/chitin deacetylase (PgdA/CDA1 family)
MLDGSLVSAAALRSQLRLLRRTYQIVSPPQFRLWLQGKLELPPHSVLITCDDCLQNVLSDMLPVLREFEVPCLFFATGSSLKENAEALWYEELYLMMCARASQAAISVCEIQLAWSSGDARRAAWWTLVQQLSAYEPDKRREWMTGIAEQLGLDAEWRFAHLADEPARRRFLLLNRNGLETLARSPGTFLGAHTASHPVLSKASDDLAWREVAGAKDTLQRELGLEVWALAYPFGDPGSVSDREIALAEKAGYDCAFLNVEGQLDREHGRFRIPRVHVTRDMSDAEFEAHLSGFHRSVQRLAGRA